MSNNLRILYFTFHDVKKLQCLFHFMPPATSSPLYCEGIIPFFHHVAKSHPRNLKLVFHPFWPDSAVPDSSLVTSWTNGRSAPCSLDWCKFQGKNKNRNKNNFTSPRQLPANPHRLFANGSFSNTTADGIKPSTCGPSGAVNSQTKWLNF